jgi:IS5 family transposase
MARNAVWGDGGYQGQTKVIRAAAPKAQDMTCRRTRYKNYVDEEATRKNTTKARVRAKVEHPFRILKRVFGLTIIRCAIGVYGRITSGYARPSRW